MCVCVCDVVVCVCVCVHTCVLIVRKRTYVYACVGFHKEESRAQTSTRLPLKNGLGTIEHAARPI